MVRNGTASGKRVLEHIIVNMNLCPDLVRGKGPRSLISPARTAHQQQEWGKEALEKSIDLACPQSGKYGHDRQYLTTSNLKPGQRNDVRCDSMFCDAQMA